MNFLKVVGLRFIVFSILFPFLIISCSNSVNIEKLVFNNKCQILFGDKLYSGKYKKTNPNNYLIIGIVKNGFLTETKEYIDEIKLIRLRKFDSCGKGLEEIYSEDGKLSWKGKFENYKKRIGLWKFYSKDSIYEINY